jgi:uroporphyrinogen-III synthase
MPEAERTAARLRSRGHQVLLAPLTRIEPTEVELGPGPWAAILFTSANAPRSIEFHPRIHELVPIPVFAVGHRTAQAAREVGFVEVVSPDGTVRELVELVAACHPEPGRPLLYLAGLDRAGDVVADLAARSIAVELRVSYRAVADPRFSADTAAALGRGAIDAVLHYSRRSAAIFLQAAEQAGLHAAALRVRHLCLSPRIGEPLLAAGAQDVRAAVRPTEAALLRLIEAG